MWKPTYREPAIRVTEKPNKWIKYLFFLALSFFIFSFFYYTVFGYTFPDNAITIQHELVGAGSATLLATSTRTILGISIQQSGNASVSQLNCNGTVIAFNYGKDFPFNLINSVCNGPVQVSKTGNDSASFIITYVDYDISVSRENEKTQPETLATLIFIMSMASLSWVMIYTIRLYFSRPKRR